MPDIKWIKLNTDMFDNEKIKLIQAMPEGDTILVIWIRLIILAGRINDEGLIYLNQNVPYTEEMLSTIFCKPLPVVKLAINTFQHLNMLGINRKIIELVNWAKYQNVEGMELIRLQNRNRQRKRREIKKLQKLEDNGTRHVTVTLSHALDIEEDIEVEYIYTYTAENFDSIWLQYPKKDGKKQAERHFKASIKTIADLQNCIKALKNYKAHIYNNKIETKYIKNGSTFFNNWKDWVEVEDKEADMLEEARKI